ncbi:MAG: purine-nucleoside phosphorylase [Clostridia bacterium]|nr:purine-nucleoside phosphorylase [Clostridia bacterium]
MATPHISAEKGDFAKTVLMPGDPLRAKLIAENFLEDARLVNEVRGALGYTGQYNGKSVSVMASGMGVPSIGIYSYELFKFYGVENIIRIGTAGALSSRLRVRDIVMAMSAATDSNFSAQYELPGTPAPTASFELLIKAYECAQQMGLDIKAGQILTSDVFYSEADNLAKWQKMGVLAVEMECAALYLNAARLGKNALAICTISDCPLTGESSSSEEREKSFTDMMKLGLECAVSL